VVGRHVGHHAAGNIVYTEDPNDVIVTVGVQDLIIVKRGNTVLLVRKDRIAEIKDVLADARLAGAAEPR
jgi:mannose-1-phosphate guanylyltransferase